MRPGAWICPLAGRLVSAIIAALAASPAWAQRLGGDAAPEISYWRVFGALILCLALAVAAAFALRHRMRAGGRLPTGASLRRIFSRHALFVAHDRRLELRESLRLSHQADLFLVALDGREMLLAVTASGVVLVEAGDAGEAEVHRTP